MICPKCQSENGCIFWQKIKKEEPMKRFFRCLKCNEDTEIPMTIQELNDLGLRE